MLRSTPPTRGRPSLRAIVTSVGVVLLLAAGLAACQAMSALSYLAVNREMASAYPSGFPYASELVGGSEFPFGSQFAYPSDFPGMSGFPYGSDPCMSAQPSFVSFSHGGATVDLVSSATTQHLILGQVDGAYTPGGSPCGPGTGAVFSTLNGVWTVEIDGSPDALNSSTASVLVSYDNQGTSFLADNGGSCRATVTEADTKGIVGTATCTNIHWVDDNDQTPAPSASFGGTFSATITFEARP